MCMIAGESPKQEEGCAGYGQLSAFARDEFGPVDRKLDGTVSTLVVWRIRIEPEEVVSCQFYARLH